MRAYRGALNEAGITPDPNLQRQCDFDISSGVREGRELLQLEDRPTAIFAFNDMVAIGVMQAARELGVRIPADLSLVGYDDTVEASLVYPALTTVRQPLAEMGRMGVTQLCRLLAGRNMEALHVELATKDRARVHRPGAALTRPTSPPRRHHDGVGGRGGRAGSLHNRHAGDRYAASISLKTCWAIAKVRLEAGTPA